MKRRKRKNKVKTIFDKNLLLAEIVIIIVVKRNKELGKYFNKFKNKNKRKSMNN